MTTAHRSIDEGFSSVTAPDEPWVDTKRRWWLLGLIVPTLPVLAWAAGTFSGISLGWWLGPFLVVVVIPGVDALLGEDRSNPPESAVEQLSADRFYRWCTYLYLPLQYAGPVSYTHLRAHETVLDLVCRLLLEKKTPPPPTPAPPPPHPI